MADIHKKVIDIDTLKQIVAEQKNLKKRMVWTNGCFDILHVGHVRYLQEAKKLGDVLIIGLNSDDSVRKLKGLERPLQSEEDRAEILAALECVDYIIIFPEPTVERYLKELHPEIFVKGADYTREKMHQGERKMIEDYGGKIVFLHFIPGKSTTSLVEKIKSLKDHQ